MPKARAGANAPLSISSAGRAGAGGEGAPRRMLCQPIHSVQDAERGLVGGAASGGGGGETEVPAEDPDDWGVRRGRRVRKQVHPSLSEDTMAAALGDNGRSGYEDSDGGSDGDGDGGGAYGDAPFRFRTSEAAPWGEGDRPLIKVGRLFERNVWLVPCLRRSGCSRGCGLLWLLGLKRRLRFLRRHTAPISITNGFLSHPDVGGCRSPAVTTLSRSFENLSHHLLTLRLSHASPLSRLPCPTPSRTTLNVCLAQHKGEVEPAGRGCSSVRPEERPLRRDLHIRPAPLLW